MDLLSGLGFGGSEKGVAKHVQRLTSPNTQHEDRLRAAELLAEQGTDESLFGLLRRYDLTLEKSYMDMDEKVYVKDLLVQKGEAAVEPIRRFMKTSENVNWPERILSYILDDEKKVLGVLLDVLEAQKGAGDMKGQKRARMLSLLTKYRDPRIAPAMVPFLYDFDEGVRFTAVEVIDAQEDSSVKEDLIKVMTGPEEESNRVRHRILETFVKLRWSVVEYQDTIQGWLPEGFALQGETLVEL